MSRRGAWPPELDHITLNQMRDAIQANRVSFPSQVPIFRNLHKSDIQWRLALLYFVRAWSCDRIAERYGIVPERVRQLLRQWRGRAIVKGYVRWVHPDAGFVEPHAYRSETLSESEQGGSSASH